MWSEYRRPDGSAHARMLTYNLKISVYTTAGDPAGLLIEPLCVLGGNNKTRRYK